MSAVAPPPFSITSAILSQVEQVGEAVGRSEAAGLGLDLRLRREARVRTVHGSVAIEGNVLSEEQVSAILDGKRVVAPPKDIQEVRNAIAAYDLLDRWAPSSEADLLTAHEILMTGLVEAPGRYRAGAVGVIGPDGVHHIGPPASRVPGLMADLLGWLRDSDEHPLIASSVFHYEFEFIHPFEDGNGRLGPPLADPDPHSLEAAVRPRAGGKRRPRPPEPVLRGDRTQLSGWRKHALHRLHAGRDPGRCGAGAPPLAFA